MTPPQSPCRLSVFLASQAPVGVILRRGPSEWVQLVLWNRENDTFTEGQWFHGRVYVRRCDLSPNGKLFVYFAAKHGPGRHYDVDVGEAWTAISKPPYFTALALWPNLGSWYGGGVFHDDTHVQLDSTCGSDPHPEFTPDKRLTFSHVAADAAPWERRLLRDGWRLVERGFDPRTHRRVGSKEVWEKPHATAGLKLCRQVEDIDFQRYGGPYAETFWLETPSELVPIPDATWADWDDDDRLAVARDGMLCSAALHGSDLRLKALHDFNPHSPKQVPTPDWAKRW